MSLLVPGGFHLRDHYALQHFINITLPADVAYVSCHDFLR